MNPTQTLPEGYTHLRRIDLSKEGRLLLALNIAGLALFILFGWLFFALAAAVHPGFSLEFSTAGGLAPLLLAILKLLLVMAATLILHELAHGLMFWVFTRRRPRFGLRAAYAYAAAPDWFLPRNRYLWVGLAPLLLLSLVGVAVLPFLPSSWLPLWWFFLVANASGAVGDLYVVGWLLKQPETVLVKDHGDCMDVFIRGT
jgi:hypothetical protein